MDRFSFRHCQFCLKHHLIRPNLNILVQVSGGSDSVCLAVITEHFKEQIPFNTSWIHFNHGLRKSANAEEKFVKNLAKKYDVPLRVFHYPGKFSDKGIQHDARKWRRNTIRGIIAKTDIHRIFTGHQLDDLAETFFWRISRGTSLFGLTLMQPLDDINARPLLHTEKKDLQSYLRSIKQNWCEDAGNKKNSYTRNKIRNELIPLFQSVLGGHYKKKIKALTADAALLNEQITPDILDKLSDATLPYSTLKPFSRLLTNELISRWLEKHLIIDAQRRKIDTLANAVHGNMGGLEIEVGQNVSVFAGGKKLTIIHKTRPTSKTDK